MAGNCVITTSRFPMNANYKLIMEDCRVEDLVVNNQYSLMKVFSHTFADSIMLRNCIISNVSGSIFELDREQEDIGIYNAEHVNLENCVFDRVQGTVLSLYRGGTDESTFGPNLVIDHCFFNESGTGKRNRSGALISLHGVQFTSISNSQFRNCAPVKVWISSTLKWFELPTPGVLTRTLFGFFLA